MITTFKEWVKLRESAGTSADWTLEDWKAEFKRLDATKIPPRSYEPLITAKSVLFPVIHDKKVISTSQALQKMQELAKKGAVIWHEGEQAEPVVDTFLQKHAQGYSMLPNGRSRRRFPHIPELAKLQKKSWETIKPKTISQQRFQQGGVLTSIFGGNKETKQAQGILGHPLVKQALQQQQGTTFPSIHQVLSVASNVPEGRIVKKIPQAKIEGKWINQPEGWNVYSPRPLSPQEIEDLVNLAQEPNMKVFRDLLRQPATKNNLVMFLKIGRHQGFNSPYANPNAPLSSLGKLQQDVNYERDLWLLSLVQQDGGIFFAGADHVPNVTKLMQQQQGQ